MRYLVTGGKGFIGSVLVRKLEAEGHSVRILDKASNGEDILYYERDGDYDCVFHLASLISVAESITYPNEYFKVNVWGTYRILDMFKDTRVINISSCVAEPMKSPYGLSKRLGEVITDYFPNAVTARLYNVFGEGERKHIFYIWAKKMIRGEAIEIFGDGTAKRDYIYVDDAIDEIIKCKSDWTSGTIQIGYGKTITALELFKMMSEFFGYKRDPVFKPEREGDQYITVADRECIGKIGFEEGLKRTLEHFRKIIC